MKQIKKFRKNNWSEEEVSLDRKNYQQKKFNRALRTRDVEFLSDYDEY